MRHLYETRTWWPAQSHKSPSRQREYPRQAQSLDLGCRFARGPSTVTNGRLLTSLNRYLFGKRKKRNSYELVKQLKVEWKECPLRRLNSILNIRSHRHSFTEINHLNTYPRASNKLIIPENPLNATTYRETTLGSQSPPQYLASTGSLVELPS